MFKYILKRLGYSVFVVMGVTILVFLLMRMTPGSPARLLLGDLATDEEIAAKEKELGLDKSLVVQYITYMLNVAKGDLGTSYYYKQPNVRLIFSRVPATAELALWSMFMALAIAIPLGVIAGVHQGKAVDFIAMLFALLGQSISSVVLGLLMILLFAVKLGWLPALGYGSFIFIIMPASSGAMSGAALFTRMTRSGMVDVLQEDYITATYAKGINKNEIIMKYALRNTLLPVVTIVGLQISALFGGAVITEQIFTWPGIGTLMVTAIGMRDFSLVQSMLLIISVWCVLINLVVDIIYTFIDPRMSFS